MMETGVEEFLQLKRDGKLGEGKWLQAHSLFLPILLCLVPIIVVFTKYDRVVTAGRLENKRAGGNLTLEEITRNASDKLKQDCFVPFEEAVGKDLPYLPVSGLLIANF